MCVYKNLYIGLYQILRYLSDDVWLYLVRSKALAKCQAWPLRRRAANLWRNCVSRCSCDRWIQVDHDTKTKKVPISSKLRSRLQLCLNHGLKSLLEHLEQFAGANGKKRIEHFQADGQWDGLERAATRRKNAKTSGTCSWIKLPSHMCILFQIQIESKCSHFKSVISGLSRLLWPESFCKMQN